jgi:hypothetical protein
VYKPFCAKTVNVVIRNAIERSFFITYWVFLHFPDFNGVSSVTCLML